MMTSVKKFSLKKVLRIVIAVLLIYCILSAVATVVVYNSIFSRYDAVVTVPAALQPMVDSRQHHTYPSGEHTLSGYLYRAEEALDRQSLVVIAPGFQASADSYLWQVESLLSYGWSVFIFDPTGSCSSQGSSAIGFSQELLDLEATLKYIANRQFFGYNDLVLLGHSRGGYAACCALRSDYPISAVVSVSGIDSAMDGVIGSAENYVGPLAYANYGFLWLYQTYLFDSQTVNLSACGQLAQTHVPALIIHGATDAQVSLDRHSIYGQQAQNPGDHVRFLLWTESQQDGHTSILFDADGTANDELMAQIHLFFAEHTMK